MTIAIIRRNENVHQVKSQNCYTSSAIFEIDGERVHGELLTSYRTPVAAFIMGEWYFSPRHYSVTTSKQITLYTGIDSKSREKYIKENPEKAIEFLT